MQVGEQELAGVCCPAEAAGSDPEEWGLQKRVRSVPWGPCYHVKMLSLPHPRPLWAADGGHCWAPKTLRRRGPRSAVP